MTLKVNHPVTARNSSHIEAFLVAYSTLAQEKSTSKLEIDLLSGYKKTISAQINLILQ